MCFWLTIFLLVALAVTSPPVYPHSRNWGYYPSGAAIVLLLLLVVFWWFAWLPAWFYPPGWRWHRRRHSNPIRTRRNNHATRCKPKTWTRIQGTVDKFKKNDRYEGREKEVAARIVNKQRAQYGETKGEKRKDREGKSPDRNLPISNYQHKTIPEIQRKLKDLSKRQLDQIDRYESDHKDRKGVHEAVERAKAAWPRRVPAESLLQMQHLATPISARKTDRSWDSINQGGIQYGRSHRRNSARNRGLPLSGLQCRGACH